MKKMLSVLLAVAACVSITACGAKQTSGKQPATADVVKAVADQLTLKDAMMTLDDSIVSNFYNVDEEKIAEKTCYVSASRATAEEVTVFKVKDASDVQMVKDAFAERIEDQKIAYENYVPAEMVKINAAVTYVNGNYVILVMADDVSKVKGTFSAQF